MSIFEVNWNSFIIYSPKTPGIQTVFWQRNEYKTLSMVIMLQQLCLELPLDTCIVLIRHYCRI